MSDEPLLYVYAVVRSADVDGQPADPPPDVTLGGGLATVEHRGLTAVVEQVPAVDFDEAPLRERLEDLDWLATVARAHHGVVAAAGRRTTTVPLRLATVCRGEPGVRRLLAEGERGLSEALGRLAGAHEWGVKLYADETPGRTAPAASAPDAPGPTGTAPSDGGGSGRDHPRPRPGERHERQNADDTAARTARELHETLAGTATEAILHPLQQTRLSRAPGRNVLNAAYLVPDGEQQAFLDAVPRTDDTGPGLRVEITGPWVPSSFTRTASDEEPEW
ncbi:GvpL/GvpF family gas vesicle protein [Streptomyces sp. cmx-4-25]|uniref:GvpL/GvpF family gas vesicle protein n=1 Tax=unclassified Streptomyces TaxID=2593676 RepID=UPI00397FB2A6